ncbi:hypothetical protein GCM10009743_53720 [Kribbella swartbergensis]
MTFEVTVRGFAGTDEALAMQQPVARVLCPEPEHDGPCEVPWGFSVSDDDDLVLGIYASAEKAAEVVERVGRVVGGQEVVMSPAAPGRFEELEAQYRIEHGA